MAATFWTSIESERSEGLIVDGRTKVDAELNDKMVVKSPVLEEWTVSFDRFWLIDCDLEIREYFGKYVTLKSV